MLLRCYSLNNMELSSNLWKPVYGATVSKTASFIKTPSQAAPQAQVAAPTVPSEQANINWSSPALEVAPQPAAASKTPEVAPYQPPTGASGPLVMDFDPPAPKQTAAETFNPVATNLLSGILGSVFDGGIQGAKSLLSSLGVKANQKTGDSFDRSLQGEARRAQDTEWRAGQVVDLLNNGRADWAKEVANGQHSKLKGHNLTTKLAEIKTGDREFGDRFTKANWNVTESINERAPSDHSGREVAFRLLNDKGEVEEHRGVVTGTEQFSAIFKLEGQDQKFNSNDIREMAIRPAGRDAKEPGPARADYRAPGLSPLPGAPPTDATPVGKAPANFLYTVSSMPPFAAKGLLEKFGVEPNQATGENFQPNLRGAEQKEQLQNWKLGQVAELLSHGREDLLPKLYNGHYDKLAGQPLLSRLLSEEKASNAFNAAFDEKGWMTKKSGAHFAPTQMDGKMVHFRTEGENGEMREVSGIMRASRDPKSTAIFTIDGHKGEFNNNYIDDMAVSPAPSFQEWYKEAGWQTKGDRFHPSPRELNGRFVAVSTTDDKGVLRERTGVLRASNDPGSTAIFTLDGHQGEFNNNDIRDLAVRPEKRKDDVYFPSQPETDRSPWRKLVDFFLGK
jgi:hypothetical protein